MTNLEALLQSVATPIRFPNDVAKLKAGIPELAELSDGKVQDLYGDWSEEYYCAGWLVLDEHTIEEFAEYLRGEHVPEVWTLD